MCFGIVDSTQWTRPEDRMLRVLFHKQCALALTEPILFHDEYTVGFIEAGQVQQVVILVPRVAMYI